MEIPPRRRSCEGQGQDWVMDLQIKMPQLLANHQKLKWACTYSPYGPEGTKPTGPDLGLQASRAGRKYIYYLSQLKLVVLYYDSPS